MSGRFSTVSDHLNISNEHYLMWKSGGTGPYVRAGRFFAPYGLRFAEHIFWVQRYTGYDIYNETYNLSGGFIEDECGSCTCRPSRRHPWASPTPCSPSAAARAA